MNVKKILFVLTWIMVSCYEPPLKNDSGPDKQVLPFSLEGKKALVYSTVEGSSERMSLSDTLSFKEDSQPLETDVCVFVDPAHQFQSITGFGGAITDASAETFAKLPESKREEVLNAYFDTVKGIGYNLVRTPINSSDFSTESYSYIHDFDSSLSTFSTAHDEQFRIPLIREVNEKLKGKLLLFASPWSPPAWMKDNNDMLHGGHLKKQYYQLWANYFVKFIESYDSSGLPIWAVSVQNEPMAKQKWESCIYTAEEASLFIKDHLGPTLAKSGHEKVKLIAWDHNRDLMFHRASVLLNDPQTAQYIWGIGFHWYETWTKSAPLFDNVARVREAFPEVNLLFTEGCKEKFDFGKIHDWSLGELYADNLIHDLNNGITAWCDWNILLDQTGGPNHVGNFCYAPLIGNTSNGELLYTNEFWYIGHFSKFIRPGARRVSCSSNRDFLQVTSFINPSGKLAVVVLNRTDKASEFHLWIKGKWVTSFSKPHSISTIII